ncbi:MAG: DNA topoisomerase, partial [Alphaproteobacteria bacterium]|nr:DNA topoisomerase [Alphaproteobacteria bacterium]
IFKTKAKNAQEAHEAIRPTDLARRPDMVLTRLSGDEFKLYELIWRRTIASQMAEAQIDKVAADLKSADGALTLRANGSTTAFDGFLKVYREDRDDSPAKNGDGSEDDEENRLPPLAEGEAVTQANVLTDQHFTQPPPRFTEASLVKRLEELGIGRPSTYASILQVLQDRDYVVLEKKRFVPEDRGRIVTSFLASFFKRYVQYDFTADLEDQLDKVSNGDVNWKDVLENFWTSFSQAVDGTKELRTRAVLDALNEELAPHFFPQAEDGTPTRGCPACEGELSLKLGRHGPFIGCSRYPECKFTRRLGRDDGDGDADLAAGPKVLGIDPETGLEITLRKGPYGVYVQLGEGEGKTKPKRTGVPKGIPAAEVDFDMAVQLLKLPRDIGAHPEDGEMVQAGLGRFGPYVKHGPVYASVTDPHEIFNIGLNRAVTLLAEKIAKGGARGSAKILRELGPHPEDEKPVNIYDGRYGPYVKHGRINATVPKGADIDAVTMDDAVALIKAKAEKTKTKKAAKKKSPSKKPTAKKPTAKKSASKKSAAKKKAAKKPAAGGTTETNAANG